MGAVSSIEQDRKEQLFLLILCKWNLLQTYQCFGGDFCLHLQAYPSIVLWCSLRRRQPAQLKLTCILPLVTSSCWTRHIFMKNGGEYLTFRFLSHVHRHNLGIIRRQYRTDKRPLRADGNTDAGYKTYFKVSSGMWTFDRSVRGVDDIANTAFASQEDCSWNVTEKSNHSTQS